MVYNYSNCPAHSKASIVAALFNFTRSLECLKVLLEAGANVTARDMDKATPLHIAARLGKLQAVVSNMPPGKFSANNAVVHVCSRSHETDLLKCTCFITKCCSDMHACSAAVHALAATTTHVHCMLGVDVAATFVMHAVCMHNNKQEMLLEYGSDPTAELEDGTKPGQKFDVTVPAETQKAIKAVMKKAVSEWKPPVVVAAVPAAAVEISAAAAAVADNDSAAAAAKAKAASKDKLQLQIACCSVS
eukprot:6419-Heterococcus_DN1.PRE.4